MAVNAADEQRNLTMLVLDVRIDPAADQKLGGIGPSILASQVQWRGQRGVDQIWSCSCSLQEKHASQWMRVL